MTPAQCAAASDDAIHAYLASVGALGDADLCRKAIEMLASKCGLALVLMCGPQEARDVLLRSALNARAATVLVEQPGVAQ